MARTRTLRVAMASAHFPPNFVSGGTLVPQRSARALSARGHEVGVFAGWIGDEHPRYDTWDETDEEGLEVRWVATYFGWSERRNYDNPAVARLFGTWLDEFRPDVVHLHSLQTLGAGLVHECTERDLPVVVTLHDFWWWCARQFLVDRELRPCSLVVEAGACPCEVDRGWLEERSSITLRALERADRVVAVSQSTAAVALANGVDPRRLVVIEPGIERPKGVAPRAGTDPGTSVLRFVYAGGSNPMKGVEVLAEAARILAPAPRWHLTAFGCSEWPGGTRNLPVEIRPQFDPSQLGQVLAQADVLVVPSVMRESYSTLTREAISQGVPVVCSTSLGPEEVVEDGVNGLLVETADPRSLARAIVRLLEEPGLLARLRSGCRSVELPGIEDHVTRIEALYDQVMDTRRARRPLVHRITRVLFVVGIDGAPLRYRAYLPAEALAPLGVRSDVRHYLHPDTTRLAQDADIVVFYRVPATIQVLQLISGIRRLGTPAVFDVDDLIFDPALTDEIPALSDLAEDEVTLWWEGVRRYRTTMENCDAFIGSTDLLCAHASSVTSLPAHRFPNGAGRVLARLSDEALHRRRTPGPVRVGYLSGTKTHAHDWRYVEPAVVDLLESRHEVELWLCGLVEPTRALDRFGGRVRRIPTLAWTALPGLLRDLDVNLAPMTPSNLFNEAKSPIKWLEAALTETPTIASPTAPFVEVIDHSANGLLAGDLSGWVELTRALIDDPLERQRIGARARRDALLGYAPARQGRLYLSILERIAPRAENASTWAPEMRDEPLRPYELEPYPPKVTSGDLDGSEIAVSVA